MGDGRLSGSRDRRGSEWATGEPQGRDPVPAGNRPPAGLAVLRRLYGHGQALSTPPPQIVRRGQWTTSDPGPERGRSCPEARKRPETVRSRPKTGMADRKRSRSPKACCGRLRGAWAPATAARHKTSMKSISPVTGPHGGVTACPVAATRSSADCPPSAGRRYDRCRDAEDFRRRDDIPGASAGSLSNTGIYSGFAANRTD